MEEEERGKRNGWGRVRGEGLEERREREFKEGGEGKGKDKDKDKDKEFNKSSKGL